MKPLLILGSSGLCFLAALAMKPNDTPPDKAVEAPRVSLVQPDVHAYERLWEKGIDIIPFSLRSSAFALDHSDEVLHWGDGAQTWPFERPRLITILPHLDEEEVPCDAQGELLPEPTVDRGALILEHLRQSLRPSTGVANTPDATVERDRTDPRNYGLWLQANEGARPLQRRSVGNQGLVLETLPPWHLDHADDNPWHDLSRTAQALQERMDDHQQHITNLSHELEKLTRHAPAQEQ